MNTPEFLVWAIEYACPIRGFQNGSDPERTERHLRGARSVSDAEREGRVFEGVAVLGEEGFRVEEVMRFYGGLRAVEEACGGCPANVLASIDSRVWAGCFGMVACPWRSESFHAAVNGAVGRLVGEAKLNPTTTPAWHGLWIGSPLVGDRAAFAANVLAGIEKSEREVAMGLDEFARALRAAAEQGLSVHVAAYPEGSVDGRWFVLSPHCLRCQATWATPEKHVCAVCGYPGHPLPLKKRRAKGRRPYFPLARLLGSHGAREFLEKLRQ